MQVHFEPRDFITVGIGCLTVISAYLIAYWHRKQMRQIEAYKRNPEVGLLPPPSPLWTFIRKNWLICLMIVQVVVTFRDVTSSEPVTRKAIFDIASDVAVFLGLVIMLFLGKILALITWLGRVMFETTKEHIDIHRETVSLIRESRRTQD